MKVASGQLSVVVENMGAKLMSGKIFVWLLATGLLTTASLAARGEMVLARVKSGTQHATHTDETRPRILTRA